MNRTQWYLQVRPDGSKYKVGYYDIEFSDRAADYGYITCWSIKPRDSNKIVTYSLTTREIVLGHYDERLMKAFLREVQSYDVLVGFYSSMCDAPYLRARCLYHDLGFIPFKTKYHLDLYFALRGKVALQSKSLKSMTKFVGIQGKVDLSSDEWLQAKFARPEAMKKLIKRNQYDCIILEKLHKKYEDLVLFNKNWL